MAPSATQVRVQDTVVDGNGKVRISAVCTDCDTVVAVFGRVAVQMEAGPGNLYRRSIPAFKIAPWSGNPVVYAIKSDGTVSKGTGTQTLTVSQSSSLLPEEFFKALLESELTMKWKNNPPKVVITYDERQLDRKNEFGVIIKPNKNQRENKIRMSMKNVHCPLTLYIIHPESYEKCREFCDHIISVEESNINLINSQHYDWLEPKDEGYRIPAREAFKIVHDVVLHIDYQETDLDDT